jgi:hypothetical protein
MCCLFNLEEFDFELQSGTRGDDFTRTFVAVGQVGRNNKSCLATFLHHGNTLLPSLDDTVQREGDRLSTIHRRIKDGSIGQSTVVVNLHSGSQFRARASSCRHFVVDHATVRGDGFRGAFGKFFDKVGTIGLDTVDQLATAVLQNLVQGRSVRLQDGTGIGRGGTLEVLAKGFQNNVEFVVFQETLEVALSTNL